MRNASKAQVVVTEVATEQPNPASINLDQKSALEIALVINAEDTKVAVAVKQALPRIAAAIDLIAESLRKGGRLIYVGTGTSGRIAALDAVECPPTFGTDPKMVQFIIAGGPKALAAAVESNEDSAELGERAIAKMKPGKRDVVVGIAASGRTPFTIAALRHARRKGAKTVAVVCNPNSELEKAAEIGIVIDTGAEVISGSTRMKAGTAQKMVLNMLSSGAFTRLGYVYGNLMVNVRPKNVKLAARGIKILQEAAGIAKSGAEKALDAAGGSVPLALLMLQGGVGSSKAKRILDSQHGHVRQAIAVARERGSR